MGLWIKNADGTIEKAAGGGGGGGGPHNHAEYALVEHDHDEFTHDHDYLPLAGGTVTGDLQVDGQTSVGGSLYVNGDYVGGNYHRGIQNGTPNWPIYSFDTDPHTGMYLHSVDALGFSAGTTLSAIFTNVACQHYVPVRAIMGSPAAPSFSFIDATGLGFYLKSTATQTIGISGRLEGSVNFRIAEDIDTADVLDRAETAAMPVDDEGVATTDAESITVNEVVTALLAKVKQLSAEIEELKKGA